MERWSGGDVSSVYRGRMEGRGGVGTARVVGKGAMRISTLEFSYHARRSVRMVSLGFLFLSHVI